MKKITGIILAVIMSVMTVPCTFAEGLLLSEDIENIDFNEVVEFEFIASEWALEEIESAQKINLIPENLAKENLTENITRAEFAAIAVKLYENLASDTDVIDAGECSFDDIVGNIYYEDILKASVLKITNGTSENAFSPNNEITREQMATMLTRAVLAAGINTDTETELSFADSDEVSDYAKSAVCFMSENGIINGVGDNKFAPRATATREQAILIAYRSVSVVKKSDEQSAQSLGNVLFEEFESIVSIGSVYEVAESLVTSPSVSALSLAVMEVAEGYLTGFDNAEITGFSEGVMFAPMIGTIPFVGYIFELEDEKLADGFISSLESAANLRWNICTSAEEMVTGKSGNKVFFVMCPTSLGE